MYFFSPEHPPLTEPARKALDWAIDVKLKSGMYSFHDDMSMPFCDPLDSPFSLKYPIFKGCAS